MKRSPTDGLVVTAYRLLLRYGPLTSCDMAELLGISRRRASGFMGHLVSAGGSEAVDMIPHPDLRYKKLQRFRAIVPWNPPLKPHPGNSASAMGVTAADLAWMQAQRDYQAARRAHRARVGARL